MEVGIGVGKGLGVGHFMFVFLCYVCRHEGGRSWFGRLGGCWIDWFYTHISCVSGVGRGFVDF